MMIWELYLGRIVQMDKMQWEIDRVIENKMNIEFDFVDQVDELVGNASISRTSMPIASTQTGKKVKKRSRSGDLLVDVLTNTVKEFSNMYVATGDNIRRMVDYFQYETDGATRRMKVSNELKKFDGLTNAQRVKVRELLVQNQANPNYFFTLNDGFKLEFLIQLLE